MLTHSTGFGARNLNFPLDKSFIVEFSNIVEEYDETVFGSISDITYRISVFVTDIPINSFPMPKSVLPKGKH